MSRRGQIIRRVGQEHRQALVELIEQQELCSPHERGFLCGVGVLCRPRDDRASDCATITIGTNNWNSFWNTVTFGLLCKNTQTATVTASDYLGGAVTIEYYLADTELATLADVQAITNWTACPSGGIPLNPNNKFIVYIKLSDGFGNTTFINTAGIVLYTDSEQDTAIISFTKGSGLDQTADVILNGNTINRILNGPATLTYGTHYTVSDGKITIKATYLETLAVDNYTLTVYYNPLGVEYPTTPLNGSDAPNTTTIALTVSAAPSTVTGVTLNPATVDVQQGQTQQFTSTVAGTNSPPQGVTWKVSGNTKTGTTINAYGLLTIDPDEPSSSTLIITAASTFDGTKFGTATVTVEDSPIAPDVISVAVSPSTANVQKGSTKQFTAVVTVQGGASETVTWNVNSTNGSTISASGLLTVAAGEAALTLTVTATSTVDSTKFGSATITVIIPPVSPAITTTALPNGTVGTAYTQTLNATGDTPITWSLDSGALPDGLTLSANGVISGTPTASSTFSFTVRAGNGNAPDDTKELSIIVNAATVTTTHNVTVRGSYTSTTGAGNYVEGATVTIDGGERRGYTFGGWTIVSGGVTLANANSVSTTFIMPANSVTVTANWTQNTTPPVNPPTDPTPTPTPGPADTFNADNAKEFAEAGKSMTVEFGIATVILGPDALMLLAETCKKGGSSIITVEAETVLMKDLSKMQAAQVKGYETVINIDVYLDGEKINVPLTVSIPYILKPNENSAAVRVWHMDEDGKLTCMNGVYDPDTGKITFSVPHQSYFVVGYDPVLLWINIFNDLDPEDLYYEAIAFMNQNGLYNGYGNGMVGPDDSLTRAQFATLLWALESKPLPIGTGSFNDVAEKAWYYNAITWAAENSVVAGYGNGNFGPEDPVTRQQAAQMLYNYAVNFKGYNIPENHDIPEYADKDQIDAWAETAAKKLAVAGVLPDEDGFRPDDNTTRGEAADMFRNFMRFIAGE